ncbi:NADH-quinone oxidoreductase subunit E [Pararhodobacter sp. SW119]|uniref:NADH-quinone oxidoreductase subunit E n=1 Tax=Pararhodobacter sp. SW119 TaxID=2780075 RepID=UPI001ADF443F|nr:NADH-quinone oxidoreductase subunit E [Pararhodobacter sp. SW119]
MLRRLHPDQPESFAFTPANQEWAQGQISKYPEGRQASAIIPLLWRAQEQEGWLSRPAIEQVADMLAMPYIRALEVATFYFMFQLQPVGSLAHVQVCGTTSCMICGAEDLIAVCREKIAPKAHQLSDDGRFSWEEVECLGACANAPMVQIGKDYYEDLTSEKFAEILDELAAGRVPMPGPQNGRFSSEPAEEQTSLAGKKTEKHNASIALALDLGDTIKRIDGTEVPILTPWLGEKAKGRARDTEPSKKKEPKPANGLPVDETGTTVQEAPAKERGKPKTEPAAPPVEAPGTPPPTLEGPRKGKADDLKQIKGIGPKLEELLNGMGFFHHDQIAAWSEDEIAWVDVQLEGFKGRPTRDDWVGQASKLAEQSGSGKGKAAKD